MTDHADVLPACVTTDGILVRSARAVELSPAERDIVAILLSLHPVPVKPCVLKRTLWPLGGSTLQPTAKRLVRLRRRLAAVGLSLRLITLVFYSL
jgi:hypothetical protein